MVKTLRSRQLPSVQDEQVVSESVEHTSDTFDSNVSTETVTIFHEEPNLHDKPSRLNLSVQKQFVQNQTSKIVKYLLYVFLGAIALVLMSEMIQKGSAVWMINLVAEYISSVTRYLGDKYGTLTSILYQILYNVFYRLDGWVRLVYSFIKHFLSDFFVRLTDAVLDTTLALWNLVLSPMVGLYWGYWDNVTTWIKEASFLVYALAAICCSFLVGVVYYVIKKRVKRLCHVN